jgi:hypothetical protein
MHVRTDRAEVCMNTRTLGKPFREEARTTPTWIHGVVAGIAGASTIAAFFLVVDILAGRPLWTPTALGALFLRGEVLAGTAPAEPVLVVGYTALHALGFVGIGLPAAYLLQVPRRVSRPAVLLVALGLFAALEAFTVAMGLIFVPELARELGVGRVAVANALAAIVMSAGLTGAAIRGR